MNCRFTLAVHILGMLAWVERERRGSLTSGELAHSINTNAVVVRRILGDLRRAGLVETKRGVGGGVSLGREAKHITLRHAYEAIEAPGPLLARYPSAPNPTCSVGPLLATWLDEAFGRAEESLKASLERVTIDRMVDDLAERARAHRAPPERMPVTPSRARISD